MMQGVKAWSREDVTEFIRQVAPPGEELKGFDDRITHEGAIELAESLGEDGHELLAALLKMQHNP